MCLYILMSIEAPQTSKVSFNSVWRQWCFCRSLRSSCCGALFQRHLRGLQLTLVWLRRCPASSLHVLISAYSLHRSRLSGCLCGLRARFLSPRIGTSASASSLVQIASNRARHSDECDPVPNVHLVQSGVRPCWSNI